MTPFSFNRLYTTDFGVRYSNWRRVFRAWLWAFTGWWQVTRLLRLRSDLQLTAKGLIYYGLRISSLRNGSYTYVGERAKTFDEGYSTLFQNNSHLKAPKTLKAVLALKVRTHPPRKRPQSFWSAPGITTSPRVLLLAKRIAVSSDENGWG